MRVLGIETSCDETAAAVVGVTVESDVVFSQLVHEEFGGVVPELAARAHIEKLPSIVAKALSDAGMDRPDAVAATAGPGLIGAVLVGLSMAKSLAAAWNVPFIGVNHLEGHLLAPLLEHPAPEWPFLALVVSGGHTTLYDCRSLGDYRVVGETLDDAAGEAFDKVAKILGLGYPGGPIVDRTAIGGNASNVKFPRPLPGEFDFSFSGLKTAVRSHVQRADRGTDADVCASFQTAVVDCLIDRVAKAGRTLGRTQVALSGGVAANSELRRRMSESGLSVFVPPRHRCTDNAAMIAHAGRLHLLAGRRDDWTVRARPSWSVENP